MWADFGAEGKAIFNVAKVSEKVFCCLVAPISVLLHADQDEAAEVI